MLSEDLDTVIETENIGIAQEIVFSDEVIARFRDYLQPSVLEGVSESFRESQWYVWNTDMDLNPPQFQEDLVDIDTIGLQKVEDEIFEEALSPSTDDEVVEEEPQQPVEDDNEQPEEVVDSVVPARPTITSVSGVLEPNADGFYVVNSNPAVLTGTAQNANQIVVNGYTLSKFTAGDSEWTYFANADYDFMVEGENVYDVYALGADGQRSEALVFKVLYQPLEEEVAEPATTEEPAVENSDEQAAPVEEEVNES